MGTVRGTVGTTGQKGLSPVPPLYKGDRDTQPPPRDNSTITITVVGDPAPQGSKRHVGHGVLVESSKRVKPWRADIREAALPHLGRRIDTGPVAVHLAFRLKAPKSLRKADQGGAVAKRPDLDKLARAALDALTGVLWADDSQVASLTATKRYAHPGEPTGLTITVINRPRRFRATLSA